MKLNRLTIENFKGIKELHFEPEGGNAVIKAENGVGKTTVYDAFLWLFFGKNSEGKKDFDSRPLDQNNQMITGVVISVEAEIDCDGTLHTYRKEEVLKFTRKKEIKGNETSCWIDEVPTPVQKYTQNIDKLIQEDTFKMLTDLDYFNGKLHWEERRKVLLAIAGDIGKPKGFDELLDNLNGRSIKDYKKVLVDRKSGYVEERDQIGVRVDEIQKGLDEYVGPGNEDIAGQRDKLKDEIIELDLERKGLFNSEQARQEQLEHIHDLEAKKKQREVELANDTSGVQELMDEKVQIETDIGEKKRLVQECKENWNTNQGLINAAENTRESHLALRASIFTELKAADTKDCPTCKQPWPDDMKPDLTNINKRGKKVKAKIDLVEKEIAELKDGMGPMTKLLSKAESELAEAARAKVVRFAEIDRTVKKNKTISPSDDKVYKKLYNDIIEARKKVGGSASAKLQEIDNQRTEKSNELAQLNVTLAKADRMEKDNARLTELGDREKELAQIIADTEKLIADIDEYKTAESRLVSAAVNEKFQCVTFKLFKPLLKGGEEPDCVAIYNGTPYGGMSTGEKIFVGIDIVNVLSAHYGASVPLFIDQAESITMPIEAQTQVIRLFAMLSYTDEQNVRHDFTEPQIIYEGEQK